ncbi:MAG: translocation/assembly module TamB [Treponema sp.]|nr:translocation/assembly module TamB [Treponema sp.]
MLSIRTGFIDKIEAYTGMEIRYSSIRPAFLGSFDIRNLEFYKDGNKVLTVERARFYFSLRELIFRKKAVIHTVQIDRPVMDIDMDRFKNIFEHFKSLSNPGNGDNEIFWQIAEFLPQKADYRIRNGFFSLSDGDTTYRIEEISVNVRERRGGVSLDARFGALIKYAGIFNRTVIVETGVGINGLYLLEPNMAEAEIALFSLTCYEQDTNRRAESFFRLASFDNSVKTLFSMCPVTVDLYYGEKTVYLKSGEENPSLDYLFSYDTQTRKISADVNFNYFRPASFISLSDNWKNTGYFLSTAITGDFSFNSKDGESFDYTVNLQSGNPARNSLSASSLSDAFLISAFGDEKHIVVNDFCLNTSANTAKNGLFQGIVNYSGNVGFVPLRPEGTVSVERLSVTGKESVNGFFNISSRTGGILVSGEELTIGSFPLETLNIYLNKSGRDIDLTVFGLCKDSGAVYLDAVLNVNPGQFDASLVLESFSLFNMQEMFRPFMDFVNIPMVADIYMKSAFLDAEIFLSSDFNNIVYNAPKITLTNDKTIGMFSVSGTDHNFSLNESILYFGENELTVSADASFSNPMDMDFTIKANYLDLAWNIEAQILDKRTLIIRDPAGLHAYGSVTNTGAMSGYIEGIDYPFLVNVNPLYTNFFITLRYNSAYFWNLDVARFAVRDLQSRSGPVSFSVSGYADQDGASFKDILYDDSTGSLAGGADFSWDTDFSEVNFIVDMTDGNETGEFYYLEGSYNDNHMDISAVVSDMRLNRFVRGSGTMLVSAAADVSWDSINSFNAQVNMTSFYARARKESVRASVQVKITNDELQVNNLALDYAGVRAVLPVLRLSMAEGIARAGADIQGFALNRNIKSKMYLYANFRQIDTWLDINQVISSFNGTLEFTDIQYGDIQQDKVAFLFSGNENAISVIGGIRDMLRLEIDKEGNFFAGLSAPMPIRGSIAGVFKNGTIDAHCNDYYIDLASLWKLMANNSQDEFNITGGYVTGKMDFRGNVLNPGLYGTGRCTSLNIKVPQYVRENIRPVPFDVLAEEYEMTFGPVVTISGKGGGSVNGWLRFENWVPKNIGLDISVPRGSPIPYNINIAGFTADGDASGRVDLTFDSDDKFLEVKGDLFMNNGELGFNMGAMTARDESNSEQHTIVEFSITTGSTVEFFWPNANSPLLRANPEMGTRFLVSFDSQTRQYSLISDINVRSGEFYYMDRNFYIRQGSITFRENETQFNPVINARAEIRDRSASGAVTIYMIVENQPLLSFVPRFESSPSLTQLEIYSILGQNLNTLPGYENNTDAAQRFFLTSTTDIVTQLISGSDLFAQFGFVRQFERQLRNFLHLDMLSIRTRLLSNAVALGASGLWQSTVDRSNSVGNYFDNTTVSIGKYIGRDMFVHGTLTMRYDENSKTTGGLKFEPDIGIEWQSPFVTIRWDFFPYHPENWWVNDHSITLRWSKSF